MGGWYLEENFSIYSVCIVVVGLCLLFSIYGKCNVGIYSSRFVDIRYIYERFMLKF